MGDMVVNLKVYNNIVAGTPAIIPQAYFDNFIINSGVISDLVCTPDCNSEQTCINGNCVETNEYKNIRSVNWYPYPYDIDSPEYYNQLEKELPLIKANGFNTIWTINPWAGYDPNPLANPHVYNEAKFAGLKKVLDLLKKNNMKMMIGLNYLGQGWAPQGIDACAWTQNPTMYNSFEIYVQEFMKRNIDYSDIIYYFVFTEAAEPCSIINNPNLDWTTKYKQVATVLRPTLGSLPARLPLDIRSKIKIGYHDYYLINENMAQGESPIQSPNSFDFLSMHYYQTPGISEASVTGNLSFRYNNFRKLYPNTPMIIGEFGSTTCNGAIFYEVRASEDDQARLNLQIINYALEKGIGFDLWSWKPLEDREFCKSNDGKDDFLNEFGITNKDGSLRKSAIDIKNLLCSKYDCTP
jgi:hypothetical protein